MEARTIRIGVILPFVVAGLFAPAAAQESTALFDAPVDVGGPYTRFAKLLDLNGDGYKDALAWWYTDPPLPPSSGAQILIRAWINDQQGGLWPAWPVLLPAPEGLGFNVTVALGEFNADGLEDFVIAVDNHVTPFLTKASGSPTFVSPWTTLEPGPVKAIAVADFNDDGRNDIAVLSDVLRVYVNHGSSIAMELASETLVPAGLGKDLIATDADGDGKPDLLVNDGGTSHIYPVVNGVAQPPMSFTHGMPSPKLDAGDVDGDGDLDVVVFGTGTYTVIRRTGPSTFVVESPAAGGPARYLADVDGDGDLDGICCGGGGSSLPQNNQPSTFLIAINDGGGGFSPAIRIPSIGSERIAGAADLDHDGDVDLVGGRCVYYSRGAFKAGMLASIGTAVSSERALADLDGDADVDVVVDLGEVLRGAGDGEFAAALCMLPAAPAGTTFLGPGFPGDFDGDGDPDLLVGHESGSTFLGMRLLKNAGGGAFVDGGPAGPNGVTFLVAGSSSFVPEASLVADADGDGDLDLFTRAWTPSASSALWLNGGSGVFAAAGDLPGEYVLRVAQFNGGGVPDLLSAHATIYSHATPRVLFGSGGGTFGFFADFNAAYYPLTDRMEVGDIDADGDVDFGVVNSVGGGTAQIYKNNGVGGFTMTQLEATGLGVSRMFWLDIDGDGVLDVVATPTYATSTGAKIFLMNPGGVGTKQIVRQVFRPKAMVDVDGDGDIDVLSDLDPNGTVYVRGRRFDGAAAGMRRQYGEGSVGTGGMTPTLGAKGPFREGESCELRVTGAVGATIGFVGYGIRQSNLADSPLPGMSSYADPWLAFVAIATGGAQDGAGEGTSITPFIVPAGAAGTTLFAQAFLLDLGAPFIVSSTNGLEIQFGN